MLSRLFDSFYYNNLLETSTDAAVAMKTVISGALRVLKLGAAFFATKIPTAAEALR